MGCAVVGYLNLPICICGAVVAHMTFNHGVESSNLSRYTNRTSFLKFKNHTNGSKLNVIGAYGVSHTNLKRMTGSYKDRMIKAFLNSA